MLRKHRAPQGRKNDFRDAKRLARRLLADELMLSFVPNAEQRTWRTMTRGKQQLVRERVRLQSLGRLVWKILHDNVRYIEHGEQTNPKAQKRRTQKMVQALRKLGYTVTLTPSNALPTQG